MSVWEAAATEGVAVSPEGWPGLLFADVSVDSIRFYGKQSFGDDTGEVELTFARGETVAHDLGSRLSWRTGTLVGMNAERAVVGGHGTIFHVPLFELFRWNDAYRRSVAGGGDRHGGYRVPVAQLIASPHLYDRVWLTLEGIHRSGLEQSSLAGAWVSNGFRERGVYYVRATGLWCSKPGHGYGHFGMSESELAVETIERCEPSRVVELSRIEDLARHPHEVVRVRGRVSQTPARAMLGDVQLQGMPPLEGLYDAELVVVGDSRGLDVLHVRRVGEVHPHEPVPAAVADVSRHVGGFVRLTGVLKRGSYWPQLGQLEVVPPELYRAAARFVGSSSPPHEVVVQWNERIGEGRRVEMDAFVYHQGKLFATRIELVD